VVGQAAMVSRMGLVVRVSGYVYSQREFQPRGYTVRRVLMN
jgi:hypothetical protein